MNTKELLAKSLEKLKSYQETHPNLIVKGVTELGRVHTERLVDNGFLKMVVKGWYIPSFPGQEGETTVWYASYWHFVVAYLNDLYGTEWALSAEESLDIYGGTTIVPTQLLVRSPKAQNNVLKLPFDTSLLAISAALPEKTYVEPHYGLRLYSLGEALLFTSPAYYERQPLEAKTCLASLRDVNDVLDIATANGNTSRAGRLAGALRAVGRIDLADTINKYMTRMGYALREQNPFAAEETSVPAMEKSPHAMRIRLMWKQMREQVLSTMKGQMVANHRQLDDILSSMEKQYVRDSYHSLSIEGYRVTENLLQRVREGKWNPQEDATDAERRDALAARGYYQAYQRVKVSIEDIVRGENAGSVFQKDHQDWHFELFEPCVRAGILKISDLMGYRNHPVYIRGSKHTPLNPDAVCDAIEVLGELLVEEQEPLVRAVLGHFFFGYIHPFMDGNGRTARFVMNTMFVSAGFDWLIIPVSMRDEYMAALEEGSVNLNIRPFCELLLRAREHEVNKRDNA